MNNLSMLTNKSSDELFALSCPSKERDSKNLEGVSRLLFI